MAGARSTTTRTGARVDGNPTALRTVTFGGASSLDNFFARTDNGVDWLRWSDDAAAIMRDYWKTIDTIIMGRKTYDVSKGAGKGGGSFGGMRTYVFSRTLKPSKSKALEIVNGDAVAFVRRLKRQPGKDICCMGGGEFARSLLEAGLIDVIGLNIHPVLLGSGIPLFHEMTRQIDLELLDCRRIARDCVYVTYRVTRPE
jgi:dihydrofolate reductase